MKRRSRRAPKTETEAVPQHNSRLAARSIHGNLLRTRDETWAWYVLPAVRWSYRTDESREDLINQLADQLAELTDMWCHLRVTSRPYPVTSWARDHARNNPRPLPDADGAGTWGEYLRAEQQALAGWALADQQVFLGVQVGTRTLTDRACVALAPVLRRCAPELLSTEDQEILANLGRAADAVARLDGQPATPADMDWLMHRSVSLGLAPGEAKAVPTGELEQTDLDSYADEAAAWQEPYAPTVTIRALSGPTCGQQQSVAVLSIGDMEPLDVPQRSLPWMAVPELLGVPYEWSARFLIRPRDPVGTELAKQGDKAGYQMEHYDEHGLKPPRSLQRQAERAEDINDELSVGVSARGTRVAGFWRLAVSGADEDEAVAVANRVAELYKPRIRVEHTEAQYAHYREFIPGEPLASSAHRRRGSVTWAAAGMPTVAHHVGDRHGVNVGRLAEGSPRPVMWDPWASMERHGSSGLAALLGGLGSGKSLLGLMLVYKTLRAGAEWTVLDPSGPLAKLCDLPELTPHARHIDLLRSRPGMLNPWRVVPDPRPEHFTDEFDPAAQLRREQENVAQIRRDLVIDILTRMLPYNLVHDANTDIVMSHAVDAVAGRPDAHPGLVITQLHNLRDDDPSLVAHAHNLARMFDAMRPKLRLLIPERDADPYADSRDDRLTVLTMPGLVLPAPGTPQADWNATEMFNTQLLSLAAWLTQRNLYARPRSTRKGVWIDEAHFLSSGSTGRALSNRINRDSRKHNIRALLSSQVPQDLLDIPGFDTLCDAVLLGRLEGAEAQQQALQLAGVPTGLGYESVLGGLPKPSGAGQQQPREFLFADGRGQVERLVADFSAPHLAHVLAAGDTTPRQDPLPEPPGVPEMAGDTPPWQRTVDLLKRRQNGNGRNGNGAHANGAATEAVNP